MNKMLDSKDKNKILQTFLNSFNAMPSWLKNTLIVSLIIGVFYFGWVRPQIIYGEEKTKTEQIFKQIATINQRIETLENIQSAIQDMMFSLDEVRGVSETLSELHNDQTVIIEKYLKKVLSSEDFKNFQKEIEETNTKYRKDVNELFEVKSKLHITSTLGNKNLTDD